jgi:hypothetical protein
MAQDWFLGAFAAFVGISGFLLERMRTELNRGRPAEEKISWLLTPRTVKETLMGGYLLLLNVLPMSTLESSLRANDRY